MDRKFPIVAILLFWTSVLLAQGNKFTASVTRTTVGTGEQFEISFSTDANAQSFRPPSFNGFQVLSGPNESSSMTSINGNTSVSTSVSYILIPVKEGEFTIGPASIEVNGRKLNSNAVKIKVVKGQPVQQNNQGQPDEAVPAPNTSDISKLVLVRAVPTRADVYQGEQIILSYRIYFRGVNIVQYQVDKLPDLNGFWNEDIKVQQQQVQVHVETYKGVKYNTADIKQTILFPDHTGDITIDPSEMTLLVRTTGTGERYYGPVFRIL